jgi:hypothetical protein
MKLLTGSCFLSNYLVSQDYLTRSRIPLLTTTGLLRLVCSTSLYDLSRPLGVSESGCACGGTLCPAIITYGSMDIPHRRYHHVSRKEPIFTLQLLLPVRHCQTKPLAPVNHVWKVSVAISHKVCLLVPCNARFYSKAKPDYTSLLRDESRVVKSLRALFAMCLLAGLLLFGAYAMIIDPVRETAAVPSKVFHTADPLYDLSMAAPVWSIIAVSVLPAHLTFSADLFILSSWIWTFLLQVGSMILKPRSK